MKGIGGVSCLAAVVATLIVAVSPAGAVRPKSPAIAPASARGVTEFPVSAMRISNLTQGADGIISYIGAPGGQFPNERILGRVGPTGPLGEEGLSMYTEEWITTATDGATWLSSVKEIGNGSFLEVSLSHRDPNGSTTVIPGTVGIQAVAPAADGGVWFLQNEPDPSRYGPDSHLKIGHASATGAVTSFPFAEREAGLTSIGRVAPTPLKSVVMGGTGTVGSRGVRVALACEGGDAWSHCRGRIAVKVGGKRVAKAKYSLEADQVSQVLAPFARGAGSPLRGAKKKVGIVSVIAGSGSGTRRQLSLRSSVGSPRT